MDVVFDSGGVPVPSWADGWTETTALALVTTRFRFTGATNHSARLQAMSLGSSQLSHLSYTALSSQRTPALIRRSDPELYQLALVLSGRQHIGQIRNDAALGPGDFVLYDSSRPFEASSLPDGGPASNLVFQFPRKLLPLPGRGLDRLLATPVPARQGVGRLLADLLTGACREGRTLTPDEGLRLQQAALDLTAALLGGRLGSGRPLPSDTRRRVLVVRIRTFILGRLGEPELTPQSVAAAHHMSLRSLHRLFEPHGEPVGAFIRRQRLEHARRDLGDPALLGTAIHAIAGRWGYTRPEDFTRAFRAAYGLAPKDFRLLSTARPEGGAPCQGHGAGCHGVGRDRLAESFSSDRPTDRPEGKTSCEGIGDTPWRPPRCSSEPSSRPS
ncbi:helix-turn-helix domain-containing protein [Streptomyces sp. NPDC001373]|uniref:AraC-like ligand-binding domain-containing protein n=1 Tax=Streptomyces sp. NPDC001373 TaxID=3364565 RepID=UPI0036D1AD9C